MAILPSHVRTAIRRLIFEGGFERLEQAYITSVKDPTDFYKEAETIVRKINGIPDGTPLPPVVVDEEGVPSNDYHDDIAMFADEFESTHVILVEAFTIALFHFWEKQCNDWLSVNYYNHTAVMTWLTANGATPNTSDLQKLQLIVNAKKHGPGQSANALYNLDPTLFARRGTAGFVPSDKNLVITKQMLDGFFASVKTSA